MAKTKLARSKKIRNPEKPVFGMISKLNDAMSARIASRIAQKLYPQSEIFVEPPALSCFSTSLRKKIKTMPIKDLVNKVDYLIVVGGDGTILRCARYLLKGMAWKKTSILGVNTGHMGFLACVQEKRALQVLSELVKHKETTVNEFHSCLKVEIVTKKNKRVKQTFHVMNDVVLSKGSLSRIFEFQVDLNGEFLSSYRADGLIVCPPTGSTAYNLAAGGSIVQPGVPAIQVTPIAAQYFSNKPIVIADHHVIELRLGRHSTDVFLTLDGHTGLKMEDDDLVRVTKSEKRIKFCVPKEQAERHYFDSLRQKLNWGLVSETRP